MEYLKTQDVYLDIQNNQYFLNENIGFKNEDQINYHMKGTLFTVPTHMVVGPLSKKTNLIEDASLLSDFAIRIIDEHFTGLGIIFYAAKLRHKKHNISDADIKKKWEMPYQKGDNLKLVGVAPQGQDMIKQHGNIWMVLDTPQNVNFDDRKGCWVTVKSLDIHEHVFTIHAFKDDNILIVEKT